MSEQMIKKARLRFPGFRDHWKEKKLGDVLTIGSGRDYKHLGDGEIPVYGTGGLMRHVDGYLYDGKSICIGRKGTIDKPQFLEGKFWTVDTLFYTHEYKDSVPEFLFSIFQKINWQKYNEASGVPSLSKTTIEKIKIHLPGKDEQQKIADFLSSVDERIQKLERKTELLEKYKKGVMQKIFSQEIRFKDENDRDFPTWQSKKLEDVFSQTKGYGLSKAEVLRNGANKCVLYGELYTTYPEVIHEIVSRTNLGNGVKSSKGDLLVPCSTTTTGIDLANITEIREENVLLGGDITILRFKDGGNSTYFAYYLTHYKRRELASYAQGSTIVHLYYGHFKKMTVDVPSIEEQEKVADFLTNIDKKISLAKAELKQVQQFKKALLQRMFL